MKKFMAHWKRAGGFIVPKGLRRKVNAYLESQGYGPDMFSIPIGPAMGGGVTHYMCFMPLDLTLFDTLKKAARGNNGEDLRPKEDTAGAAGMDPERTRKFLRFLRKRKNLVVKRENVTERANS